MGLRLNVQATTSIEYVAQGGVEVLQLFVRNSVNLLRRHSDDDCPRWHVFCHDGPCADDGSIADCYSREHRDIRTKPDATADNNACRVHVGTPALSHVVVQRRDDRVVADEGAVADLDSTLVLEAAAAVDEDVLADPDVLAEVGAEWREQLERIGDSLSSQLTHQGTYFCGGVVAPVKFCGDAQRFLTCGVHRLVVRRSAGDPLGGIQRGEKGIEPANFSHIPTVSRRVRRGGGRQALSGAKTSSMLPVASSIDHSLRSRQIIGAALGATSATLLAGAMRSRDSDLARSATINVSWVGVCLIALSRQPSRLGVALIAATAVFDSVAAIVQWRLRATTDAAKH